MRRHSLTVSLSTLHTHFLSQASPAEGGKRPCLKHSESTVELNFKRGKQNCLSGFPSGDGGPLTCLWAHLIQQLHHAFALHGRPVFDGRPPSDLAVLLLDLWGATLRDERAEFAAEWGADHTFSTRLHT